MDAGVLAMSAAPGGGWRRGVVRPSGEAPPRSGGDGRAPSEAAVTVDDRREEVEAAAEDEGRRLRGM